MNLKALKEIINSSYPDSIKEMEIISILAEDQDVIPNIMKLLEQERRSGKELMMDMNLELSKAHIYIEGVPEGKRRANDSFNKEFVMDEIEKFYAKYKSVIRHCFNRFN